MINIGSLVFDRANCATRTWNPAEARWVSGFLGVGVVIGSRYIAGAPNGMPIWFTVLWSKSADVTERSLEGLADVSEFSGTVPE